jgi:hypothetical protein
VKVLFLDFDGVFNSEQSKIFWENLKDQSTWEKDIGNFQGGMLEMFAKEYCPIALSNMEHLLRRNPEVQIVVSSSWRTSRTVPELKEVFKSPLISAAIFDKTESFSNVRGEEIQKWLNEHPEVTNYVIVDDDRNMLESQQENFVRVSPLHGFQYADMLWAERILNRRTA